MKRREIEELKNKSEAELHVFVKENRDRLQALRFDLAQGKIKNVKEIRKLKKAIARALTFLAGYRARGEEGKDPKK